MHELLLGCFPFQLYLNTSYTTVPVGLKGQILAEMARGILVAASLHPHHPQHCPIVAQALQASQLCSPLPPTTNISADTLAIL